MADYFIDIFLRPGEFYFGDKETRIRTLLGSCVAITMWHPLLRVGGMCHYLLPGRKNGVDQLHPDGRYADEAISLFLAEIAQISSHPCEFEVKMFGGGDQFPGHQSTRNVNVPEKNIRVGKNSLIEHGFKITAVHLGGTGRRNIIFDIWNGNVWVKHVVN